MARYRSPKYENRKPEKKHKSNDIIDIVIQQVECIKILEKNLCELIRNCIVFGNRTTAHKCVKMIITASDGVQNMPQDQSDNLQFYSKLKDAILICLPETIKSTFSGALRWFMLLISGTSTQDSQGPIAEKCIEMLLKTVNEMSKKQNPLISLLRTRFGLYGLPFEPELFDVELPLSTKYNLLPITFASVVKSSTSPHLQNQSIDLKNFCVTEGTELRILPIQLRQRGIGNHLKGLLEVEPLHFTCCGVSEATRLENMDSQQTNQAANVIEEIIYETPFENHIELSSNMVTEHKPLDNSNVSSFKSNSFSIFTFFYLILGSSGR